MEVLTLLLTILGKMRVLEIPLPATRRLGHVREHRRRSGQYWQWWNYWHGRVGRRRWCGWCGRWAQLLQFLERALYVLARAFSACGCSPDLQPGIGGRLLLRGPGISVIRLLFVSALDMRRNQQLLQLRGELDERRHAVPQELGDVLHAHGRDRKHVLLRQLRSCLRSWVGQRPELRYRSRSLWDWGARDCRLRQDRGWL
jgi:hypothetical protein